MSSDESEEFDFNDDDDDDEFNDDESESFDGEVTKKNKVTNAVSFRNLKLAQKFVTVVCQQRSMKFAHVYLGCCSETEEGRRCRGEAQSCQTCCEAKGETGRKEEEEGQRRRRR
jgi:hypothetical protein